MPKPDPEDYVIVIKPRERVSLHEVLTETGYGTAISAYLGPERARAISVVPSRDQNIVIVRTPDIEAADRLIGDFAVNTEKDSIPLHGYLRQDGGNTCHGVIVVRNTDTTETLQHLVCWRAGTIVEIRKFGTSNKARITFAGKEKPRYVHYDNMVVSVQNYCKTIPACGQCGAVGHRADACPNLQPNTCGLCGLQAPLVEGVRAPHNCVPRCSVCGAAHSTNSRDFAAKFRTPKMAAQTGGKKNMAPKKKNRHLGPPGDQSRRETSNTTKPAPPTGGAKKRPSTESPLHGGLKKRAAEKRGKTGSWVGAVKNGNQLGEAPIPLEWKTALVTFIPKAGKAINTDNLRPISLTSCAGKLMETMVWNRLSGFLENRNVFAHTMFGFRQHRSAQDVLLQHDREILHPVEYPLNDKAVLALDLQGAFNNVTHEIILHHLSQTNCEPNTFQYIKQILSDRQSLIRIQDEEHGPCQLGTRGTPQGAALSPLLFNLAMMKLPAHLARVEGVQHALYADDISIWAKNGSVGDIEANLQQAAEIVDAYTRRCGLQCSTSKSEFVHIRPSPKCTTKMELSLASGLIPEHDEIRVLGLFIHKHRRVDTKLAKLRKVGDQVGRMVRRVSHKRGGLRCKDALRLAHAFVTSQVLYSTPYLSLPAQV
ncbi:hypothetical protein ISCGN_031365 [Ixodes scapularis]